MMPNSPYADHLADTGHVQPIFELGKNYYVRGAVYSLLGKFVGMSECCEWYIFNQASYVGTDGRYAEFVRSGAGENAELEYVGDGLAISHAACCDRIEYPHELPTTTQ